MFYNGFSQHMCQDRSRLFFRNKYTTTRLRSPAKHVLIKNFCFTIQFNPCRDFSTAHLFVCYYLLKSIFAPNISHLPFALRNPHFKNKTKQIAACSAQKKYLFRFVKRFGLVSFAKRRSEQESVFTTNNTRPHRKINSRL